MLIVTSGEFRANQKNYLDQVDEGKELLILRGKNKSYKVLPATEEDRVISPEYILEPDEDLARAITAEEFIEGAKQHIRELFSQKKQ
ncbi:MAG: type II toxin-antitoxin system Phd/YefM family antitoxin [Parabacteroides sp.]|nr:type II toxin-antitoxin system Phd/YefM family antitoxin [Parabacteroides sp.]